MDNNFKQYGSIDNWGYARETTLRHRRKDCIKSASLHGEMMKILSWNMKVIGTLRSVLHCMKFNLLVFASQVWCTYIQDHAQVPNKFQVILITPKRKIRKNNPANLVSMTHSWVSEH